TSGARAVAVDPDGGVLAEGTAPLPASERPLPPGWFEQEPAAWWQAACAALQSAMARLAGRRVEAIATSSTSGSVCLVAADGTPIGPAIMYSDVRSRAEAEMVQAAGRELADALGYRFSPSFALPKLLWLARHRQADVERARWFLAPADYLTGHLSGEWGVTDWANALKAGYDLQAERWTPFIAALGLSLERFPRVVAPGTPVGRVSPQAAVETGIPAGTPVLAGVTDGCASQFSTAAVAPGDWNSTLGTTLVVKGVSDRLVRDPEGRIYSHRHPEGHWLPGGSSTTGGEAIAQRFPAADLDRLNAAALRLAPTDLIVYPLARRGERFPFVRPEAEGFVLGDAADDETLFTACLEGVGYVERLCYQVLERIGFAVGDTLYAAGGANRSLPWLQLRADITGRRLAVPQVSGAAMGAAVLAAGQVWFGRLTTAARRLVRIERVVEPRRELCAAYDERYARFLAALTERGYLNGC
ncbi:MAG: FGGY-family carbohydrate kinase, partial [Anaerolineae bacterium]|nr:FGGY-family carbohydrate kinase [Anaerolineae bacterium]